MEGHRRSGFGAIITSQRSMPANRDQVLRRTIDLAPKLLRGGRQQLNEQKTKNKTKPPPLQTDRIQKQNNKKLHENLLN